MPRNYLFTDDEWYVFSCMQKQKKKIDWEIIEATTKKNQKYQHTFSFHEPKMKYRSKKKQLLTKKNWLNFFFYSLIHFNIYKISITTIKSNLICVYNLNHKMIKLQHNIRCEYGRSVVCNISLSDWGSFEPIIMTFESWFQN